MAIFLIHHVHSAEMCPSKNPDMVRQLASHMKDANARKFGVKILADVVLEPEHALFLVLETDKAGKAMAFAEPFLQFGSVSVKMGTTCGQAAEKMLAHTIVSAGV